MSRGKEPRHKESAPEPGGRAGVSAISETLELSPRPGVFGYENSNALLISPEYCRYDEQLSTESPFKSQVGSGCCVLTSSHSPSCRFSGEIDDSGIYSKSVASGGERELVDRSARGGEQSERDWDGEAVP